MFVIEFRFPALTEPVYAGLTSDGAAGYAPTPATAQEFESENAARAALEHGYGPETAALGHIVPAPLASRKAPPLRRSSYGPMVKPDLDGYGGFER